MLFIENHDSPKCHSQEERAWKYLEVETVFSSGFSSVLRTQRSEKPEMSGLKHRRPPTGAAYKTSSFQEVPLRKHPVKSETFQFKSVRSGIVELFLHCLTCREGFLVGDALLLTSTLSYNMLQTLDENGRALRVSPPHR